MKEECVVTKIKGKTAYISLVDKQHCGGCKACALGRNKTTAPAVMDVPCKVGDIVIAESPQKDASPLALLIYLIPLIFLVIGFFVGGMIAANIDGFNTDVSRVVFSLLFMLISFAICFLIDYLCRRKRDYMHLIVEVVVADFENGKANKSNNIKSEN